jgi:integrase
MQQVFRLYRRGKRFYCYDKRRGAGESLQTADAQEAARIVHAKNEALQLPQINLQIARAYATSADPQFAQRTWQTVIDEAAKIKTDQTRGRWVRAFEQSAFDDLRDRKLLETRAEHFFRALEKGTVCTGIFLRRLHNFALDLNWLLAPVLTKRAWPAIKFREKRAITLEEHQKILAGESNPEWRAYYEVLWHVGGAQTDTACLCADNIDWPMKVISFNRRKTGSLVQMHFGNSLTAILKSLPAKGPLFPNIARMRQTDRSKAFIRRCRLVGVKNVSLHSYRHAWAERALVAGYPERFAQEALGHKSKAVHRAYARKAHVRLPSLEEYETARAGRNVVQVEFGQPKEESQAAAIPAGS